jgi:acyl-CoA dehydrogenase
MGYMWALQMKAAQEKLKAGANGAAAQMNAKLKTADFYVQRILPETASRLAKISAGAGAVMALPVEMF